MHLLGILLLFPWSLVFLAVTACCPMHARAQWGARSCGPVGPAEPVQGGGYQWVPFAGDPDQFDLFHNGRHVGSYHRDGRFLWYHGAGQWSPGQCPVALPAEAQAAVGQNFGVDLPRIDRKAPLTYRGNPVSQARALELIGGGEIPDNTGKRRLTVIGPDADRAPVLAALRGPLAPLVAEYVVSDYPPEHWAVAKAGFVRDGKPTIYLQEPDGRTVFRLNDATGFREALEAVRKPGPYDPSRDPDPSKPVVPLADAANLPTLLAVGGVGLVVAALVGLLLAAAHKPPESEDHS